jgi:DUF1680 family protein
LVYCVEQQDIAGPVVRARLPADAVLTDEWQGDLLGGITVIKAEGRMVDVSTWGSGLYHTKPASDKSSALMAVPYYIWCNRGPNPMQVWLKE